MSGSGFYNLPGSRCAQIEVRPINPPRPIVIGATTPAKWRHYEANVKRARALVTYRDAIDDYFRLGEALSTRDKKAVQKSVSGLVKLAHPDGEFSRDELVEYLELALEMRRRVKEQLKKMGGVEYWNTSLSYIDNSSGVERVIEAPEQSAI